MKTYAVIPAVGNAQRFSCGGLCLEQFARVTVWTPHACPAYQGRQSILKLQTRSMKEAIIGTGYVGLPTGAGLASLGLAIKSTVSVGTGDYAEELIRGTNPTARQKTSPIHASPYGGSLSSVGLRRWRDKL